jgi:hypothetical protein
MPERNSAQWKAGQSESDRQARGSLTARLAVITASVTTSLVESGRRPFAASSEADVDQRLNDVNARLARIEATLTPARSRGSSDDIS